jgi:hypothetical protein
MVMMLPTSEIVTTLNIATAQSKSVFLLISAFSFWVVSVARVVPLAIHL